jgi:hypothetical protein
MTTVVKNIFEISGSNFGGLLDSEEFLCGCEFEIESVGTHPEHPQISVVEDHSLRNSGYEYKTRPNTYKDTLELFDYLHKNIKLGKEPFSHRTSIHVHVNVRNMPVDTLRQLVLAYALLEPVFFAFVGPEREHNIFCVPLSFTTMPSYYRRDIKTMHGNWHKYTAFNILPLGLGKNSDAGLGTIEFRHLYGTKDRKVFEVWLKTLKELYDFFNKNRDYNVITAIENGMTPAMAANTIIPTLASQYTNQEINSMCQDTMLDVKLSTGGLAK